MIEIISPFFAFPVLMLAFGLYSAKGGPKEISGLVGYRTSMSMKNIDTWKFAHMFIGKILIFVGLALLVISVIAILFAGEAAVRNGAFFLIVHILAFVVSIIVTEMALKKKFDSKGNRK